MGLFSKKIKLADGSIYDGESSNGVPNGYGLIIKHTGNKAKIIYKGNFKDGKLNGLGEYILYSRYITNYKKIEGYNGEFLDGEFNGDGIYFMNVFTLRTYKGQWKNGKYHGKGKYEYDEGCIEEGNFENGELITGFIKKNLKNNESSSGIISGNIVNRNSDGKCKIEYINGDIYNGDWRIKYETLEFEGNEYQSPIYLRNGHGKLILKDSGGIIESDWNDNIILQNYKLVYPDGSYYEGIWDNQKFVKGNVRIIYENGVYTGEWSNEDCNGQGTYKWSNSDYYEGQWKDGNRTGLGKYIFSSGDIYDGLWENNEFKVGNIKKKLEDDEVYEGELRVKNQKRIYGPGKYFYNDGRIYIGDFNGNGDLIPQGIGKILYPNNATYDGPIINGIREGFGRYILQDGSIYEGWFLNDTINGTGKMTFTNGNIYDGNWINGKVQGKGKLIYSNKEIYEGDWKDGFRHGNAVITNISGEKYSCTFENDKLVKNYNNEESIKKEEVENTKTNVKITEDTVYEKLEKLSGLKDKGIITEEEFNSKKVKLLEMI